jgi:hypothetical protein
MCETWIMVAFLGWMPPMRVDNFRTEAECHATGEIFESYCAKRAGKPCVGAHYCVPGPNVPCK